MLVSMIFSVFSVFLFALSSITTVCAQISDRTVIVHAWSFGSSKPHQLAQITYNPNVLSSTVTHLTLPKESREPEELIRVGLYDTESTEWRGVVTSAASLDAKYQQKVSLYLDEDGTVWHVGLSAYTKPSAASKRQNGKAVSSEAIPQVVVEIIKPTPGPQPVLNRPVVLNAEGKVQEKEPEKSFLQKYWWMIGIVLLMQIMAAGGSDAK